MTPVPQVDLNRHRELRKLLRHHHEGAIRTMPRGTIDKSAKLLNLFAGGVLTVKNDTEMTILFDFTIYQHHGAQTIVEKYFAGLDPTDDPEENNLRQAMQNPRFSVYEVEELHPGVGVAVRDLVRGGPLFVVDEGFSRSAPLSGVMAGRLLPLQDYWMTTGAAFPISDKLAQFAGGPIRSTLLKKEGRDLTKLFPVAEDELSLVITRAAIKEGTTEQVAYQ